MKLELNRKPMTLPGRITLEIELAVRLIVESTRSPDRPKRPRGVHRRPNRPPLSPLFGAKMSVSD
jgi:hypothetical protein